MTEASICKNEELANIFKTHLRWVGLSEAAQDILAILMVENYCTNEGLSPEEIRSITGFARSSISVILSQLKILGLVEGKLDLERKRKGRRRMLFHVKGGIGGLTLFGVRRLAVELQSLLDEMEILRQGSSSDDETSLRMLSFLEEETTTNLSHLNKCIRWIKSTKAVLDLDSAQSVK
ncbi:MAG: hypothetical protein ACXADC_18315 [Candidatus Thorarchaeota archaeon]|jgi:DNA-binding transcriptional regulator GbsR (MarR family)